MPLFQQRDSGIVSLPVFCLQPVQLSNSRFRPRKPGEKPYFWCLASARRFCYPGQSVFSSQVAD
jgi:hypothetical protein